MVVERSAEWCAGRWDMEASEVQLVEGWWRWEPARALRYRVLVRARGRLRLLEAVRPLGAAQLLAVPYVTESGRLSLLLPVRAFHAERALHALRRVEPVLRRDERTSLTVVSLQLTRTVLISTHNGLVRQPCALRPGR